MSNIDDSREREMYPIGFKPRPTRSTGTSTNGGRLQTASRATRLVYVLALFACVFPLNPSGWISLATGGAWGAWAGLASIVVLILVIWRVVMVLRDRAV